MSFTRFLLQRFVGEGADLGDVATRARVGCLEAWVSIAANTFLAAAKLVLGRLLNSISLTADAVHTASDVLTSVVVLVGFRASRVPADAEHPYGHGRMEHIATAVIAMLLVIAGVEFATGSVRRMFAAESVKGSFAVAGMLLAAALFKEWLARFAEILGRRIDSSALAADAWHHRSDAITNVLVAIAIVAPYYGYSRLDAFLGLAVSGFIVYTGWNLGSGAVSVLIGRGPSPEMVGRIEKHVVQTPGVHGVHKINAHDYGGGNIHVSLHIEVDEHLNVDQSHGIAELVETGLREGLGVEATVHVEPH